MHETGPLNYGDAYRPLARAVDKQWRRTADTPLAVVASWRNLAYGVSFYLRDRPLVLKLERDKKTPWVDEARLMREGVALVCAVEEPNCADAIEKIARGYTGVQRQERAIARHYRGTASKAKPYLIITIPPQPAAG